MSPLAEAFIESTFETMDRNTLTATWKLEVPVGALSSSNQQGPTPPPPPPSSSPSPRRKARGKASPTSNQKTLPPPPPPTSSFSPSPKRKSRRKPSSTSNQRTPPPPPPSSLSLSPQTSIRGTRKSVKFSPVTRIKKVASINDLKKKTNPASLWFTPEELKEIDNNCREIIDRIENGSPLDKDNDCLRGLEKLLQTEQVARDSRRSDAIKAVLKEQKTQMKWGVRDAEYLADLYQEYTYGSQDVATMTAVQDSKESDLRSPVN